MKIDLKNYKYKCDLHVHTSPASPCGQIDVETTVRYYAELGFDSFVLTNHFNLSGVFDPSKSSEENLRYYLSDYHQACEEAKKYGMSVILGIEARFPENDNDYLVYGLTESELPYAYNLLTGSFENFYNTFKNENNLIIQAHPFRKNMMLINPSLLDGVEVYNMHPGHNSKIGFAAKYAKENPHFLITGGTDFHHENHQGMCAICTKEKITDSGMLGKILKSRDYIFDIWGTKIIPYE